MVDKLNQRVIVPETPRQLVLAKILRYEHFSTAFDLCDKDVLRKLYPPDQCLQEESAVHQVQRVEHLYSVEFDLHSLSLEFVSQELSMILLLILLGLLVRLEILEQVEDTIFLECFE